MANLSTFIICKDGWVQTILKIKNVILHLHPIARLFLIPLNDGNIEWKNFKNKELLWYIHITKSRCIVNWFFNLLFIKKNVENIHSSSTLPITTIIASSISFRYSNSMRFKTWLICNCLHIQMVGLQSGGAAWQQCN